MTNSNNRTKLFGALILGAAIGGTIGIMLAPAKGSETLKILVSKSDGLAVNMKEQLADILANIKKEIHTVKEKANGLKETV